MCAEGAGHSWRCRHYRSVFRDPTRNESRERLHVRRHTRHSHLDHRARYNGLECFWRINWGAHALTRAGEGVLTLRELSLQSISARPPKWAREARAVPRVGAAQKLTLRIPRLRS